MKGMRRLRRRTFALLFGLLLLLPASAARAGTNLPGDVNGDGLVTAADAALVLRFAAVNELASRGEPTAIEAAPVPLAAGDVTGSGTVDDTDARVILHVATGLVPDVVKLAERLSTGLCDERWFDRFSYLGVVASGNDYRSENVSVTVTRTETAGKKQSVYFIADIYVQELACFRVGLSNDGFHTEREYTLPLAVENDAIVAISGDFYDFAGRKGLVCRNSEWYRRSEGAGEDVCAMFLDGTMETYLANSYDSEALIARSPYQVWSFGPSLLDENGHAKALFNSRLIARNPRSAIGYYEPGHYCFVLVDGRREDYSWGLTLKELSQLFETLGCAAAYNFDGGGTAVMASRNGFISDPVGKGRAVSDIVYIKEPAQGEDA